MPSANVWSHLNHFASEWIGEIKKFIAGILKTSSICHSNAPAVFHLEGHLPREGAPGPFANFSPRAAFVLGR
jgi:hypothetical protein